MILDGFDELVQAAAVNRYDYLEQARDFQHRQAQIGHPVAVIVTSRTIAADHARFPAGSLALQLQPFTDPQVRQWLDIWGRRNATLMAGRNLLPLPAETALAHRELAGQPLLLTMLAIFDATDNALQRTDARISRAELYEGLFTDFALREVTKSPHSRALPASRQRQLAERELQRLAVVALSMFARGRQAATEAELNLDLPVLFPDNADQRTGDAASLSPAQRATGRFFFIHKSEARPHEDRVRSYEFLHSTFGEFLIARLTLSALREFAAVRAVLRTDGRRTAGRRLPLRSALLLQPREPRPRHRVPPRTARARGPRGPRPVRGHASRTACRVPVPAPEPLLPGLRADPAPDTPQSGQLLSQPRSDPRPDHRNRRRQPALWRNGRRGQVARIRVPVARDVQRIRLARNP